MCVCFERFDQILYTPWPKPTAWPEPTPWPEPTQWPAPPKGPPNIALDKHNFDVTKNEGGNVKVSVNLAAPMNSAKNGTKKASTMRYVGQGNSILYCIQSGCHYFFQKSTDFYFSFHFLRSERWQMRYKHENAINPKCKIFSRS
jgi:hypothetical protein